MTDTITWKQLAPLAATFVPVKTGRLTQGVLHTTRTDATDHADATRWLYTNTPYSLLGARFADLSGPTIKGLVLTSDCHLQIFAADAPHFLPAGTDVQAHYSGPRLQYITFDLPDPHLRVRPVPPFCARLHNGRPLAIPAPDVNAVFTPAGQADYLMQCLEIANADGATDHAADITTRLLLLTANQRQQHAVC